MRVIPFCLIISLALEIRTATVAETPSPSEGGCQFSEVYRPEGWTVPGLMGARPKGTRMAIEGIPDGFITDLVSGKPTENFVLLACAEDIHGRLSLRDRPVKVLSLSRIELKGELYGYYAEYEPQMGTNGAQQRSLEFVRVIFSDGDGSGKFKILRYGGLSSLMESYNKN